MKRTVSVTADVVVPEGFDVVGYKIPGHREWFLSSDGITPTQNFLKTSGECRSPRFVLRRSFEWPDWLLAGWLAKDEDGTWYAYTNRPTLQNSGRWTDGFRALQIDDTLFDIKLPHHIGWEDSLIRNPKFPIGD